MVKKTLPIGLLILAVGFGLLWYPLRQLKGMQMGSAQLLFYAFASASVFTAPWLAYQVKQWRAKSQSLFLIGFSGALAFTLLFFALLSGDPLAVMSLFCLMPAAILLVTKLLSHQALGMRAFLGLLLIVLVSLSAFFSSSKGIRLHWSELSAMIAGLAFYSCYRFQQSNADLPVLSQLSAIMVCSTWVSGMVIIFSPRMVSFPQDYAALLSVLFGLFCINSVIGALLFILSKYYENALLAWLGLVISVSFASLALIGV